MYHEITVVQELEVGCVAINRNVYMVYKAYMKFQSALDCVFDLKFIVRKCKKVIFKVRIIDRKYVIFEFKSNL